MIEGLIEDWQEEITGNHFILPIEESLSLTSYAKEVIELGRSMVGPSGEGCDYIFDGAYCKIDYSEEDDWETIFFDKYPLLSPDRIFMAVHTNRRGDIFASIECSVTENNSERWENRMEYSIDARRSWITRDGYIARTLLQTNETMRDEPQAGRDETIDELSKLIYAVHDELLFKKALEANEVS